jgi:hypothetical protein
MWRACQLIQPLFRVTLSAQPSNTAIAVHPVISISFVFQASDFPGIDARILSRNTPVVLRVSDDFECHYCFCRGALWRRFEWKSKKIADIYANADVRWRSCGVKFTLLRADRDQKANGQRNDS